MKPRPFPKKPSSSSNMAHPEIVIAIQSDLGKHQHVVRLVEANEEFFFEFVPGTRLVINNNVAHLIIEETIRKHFTDLAQENSEWSAPVIMGAHAVSVEVRVNQRMMFHNIAQSTDTDYMTVLSNWLMDVMYAFA